jgi:hypothetical protein
MKRLLVATGFLTLVVAASLSTPPAYAIIHPPCNEVCPTGTGSTRCSCPGTTFNTTCANYPFVC